MVVILDDQPHLIEAYKDTLELEDFKVLLTKSIDDFFAALLTLLPEAVIIDVMLPSGRDAGYDAGIEVHRRFRKIFPVVPSILLTNRADLNADAIVDKHTEILCKREITPMDLLNKLKSMLDDRRRSGRIKG